MIPACRVTARGGEPCRRFLTVTCMGVSASSLAVRLTDVAPDGSKTILAGAVGSSKVPVRGAGSWGVLPHATVAAEEASAQ